MCLFKRTAVFLVLIIASLSIYSGCGYQFRTNGLPVGMEISSIAIPLISSVSSYKGFEADFTRVIREEFISHSRVPVVDTEKADVILVGRVSGIESGPLTYDSRQYEINGRLSTSERTSSRRLKIRLDISLRDRETGKTLWHDSSMEEEAGFNVDSDDPLATRYNQRQAMIKISRLLAKRIYLKTLERF
jgi:hypothetical protein